MIHAVTRTDILTITGAGIICTEDNRIYDYYQSPAALALIATPVPKTQIRHLFKFINQMDKSVQYAYNKGTIYDRYTSVQFDYALALNVNSVFLGQTSFNIAGTYIYEVYEVAWNGTVSLTASTAPATERDVLEPADTAGVVMGLCTKGIMMVSDKDGTAQVQYTQHEETSGTNYIYYGQ